MPVSAAPAARRSRAASGIVALSLGAHALLSLAACDPREATTAAARAPAPAERAPAAITLLYTTDEHGWLLPTTEKNTVLGGAAEMLAVWISREGHCADPAPGASPRLPPLPACQDPSTLALSGGDNWTGPAISSYFMGAPMADAMARMGYAASAFGNHEFDFGRDAFLQNRTRSRATYLAANLRVTDPALSAFALPSFAVFERRGLRIGVVGLATARTREAATASRFEGIDIQGEEAALARAIPEAWRAAPDALVLVAHECQDVLEPILARYPEWRLSFVGAGHCHRKAELRVGGVPLVNPGWRMRSYARVSLEIDPRRPLQQRVVSASTEVVDVAHPEGAPAVPPDEALVKATAGWQRALDAALGEQIGYSSDGMERDSAEIQRWIAGAWRDQLGVDLAILNKDGIRQALPRGPITKATVFSVLPFDNKLVICSLRGSDILETLRHRDAVLVGLSPSVGGRYALSDGRLLDEDRRYTVATIDFLYYGGDGFRFQAQDPSPRWTGLDWRAPVIAWTKALGTSSSAPLDARFR
ncbi:bifunctional UDP-sugar hydrolase/5'-nucleotidase [Sorangium sp. So ce1014]|uniref:bifunctional metallophosphatase/5'-nucleotidase n=1 Tax=Sorangium sp. So ce1014 TaxID=3133326 RepID=UPI003F5EBA2E